LNNSNPESTRTQFEQEASSIKTIIYDMINGGNTEMAKQILEQYTMLNSTDPEIPTIKKVLYPDGTPNEKTDKKII